MTRILTNDNPDDDKLLHRPAKKIKNPHATEIIFLMQEMEKIVRAPGVAGIAATQLGKPWRLFAINIDKNQPPQFFFNPKIIAKSGNTRKEFEGCLSVLNKHGLVESDLAIVAKWQDRGGNSKTQLFDGSKDPKMAFVARCIQHEMNHLDGILYVDIVDEVIDNEQLNEA